jgi:thiamine pyrophosphate-dependent acetolactate synthase large subunit-like protein
MSLGTLVTIAESGAENLVLFVLENGVYEISGNQPVPGAGTVDFPGLARAAGFPRVYSFRLAAEYEASLPQLLSVPGPVFVGVRMEPGTEGPMGRSRSEEVPYLRPSLAESAHRLRRTLTGA